MRIFRPSSAPAWLEQVLASIERLFREIMPAPFRLKGYAAAELPSAADYAQGLIYDSTATRPAYSDGAGWRALMPYDATLAALAGLDGSAGILVQTAADSFAKRALSPPPAGLTIVHPAGAGGNPTFALANDLAAVEGLGTTGLAARTAADAWTTRTLTAPAAGITVTNGSGVAGNPTLALANDLAALEGLSGAGLIVRTATDAAATRTITGTANEIAVTNGDGVAGNPTVALPAAIALAGKTVSGGTFSGVTLSGTTQLGGGQLAFPATQNPSADANTLDDYEEGTFTPQLQFGGASTGMTTSAALGRFTKIGRSVRVQIRIALTAKGSATGAATIAGLPFPSAALPSSAGLFVAAPLTTVTVPLFIANPSATTIGLYDYGTGSTIAALTDADFGPSTFLILSFSYDT